MPWEPDEETEERRAYDRGFVDGLKAHAHWKDGKQYVGTSGTTLAQAIADRADAGTYVKF
jgi:hypothetical protein